MAKVAQLTNLDTFELLGLYMLPIGAGFLVSMQTAFFMHMLFGVDVNLGFIVSAALIKIISLSGFGNGLTKIRRLKQR